MIAVLTVAVVLLAVVTVFNLVLCFAIIRRLRSIKGSDNLQSVDADLPAIGTPVATFAALDTDGSPITDEDLRTGSAFVGLLKPGCPACETFVSDVQRRTLLLPSNAIMVVAADEPAAAGDYARRLRRHTRVVVADPETPLLRAFGELKVLPLFLGLQDGVVATATTNASSAL